MPLIDQGSKAPAFALADQADRTHSLKDYLGRPVILYFYPKDDTPGCTKEACEFRDLLPKFDTTKAVVLGVSPDDVKSHAAFAAKFKLTFAMLADVPAAGKEGVPKVCDSYGVWQEKTMLLLTYMGVVRTTYLIDADGMVARRWDRVKVDGHAADVLAAIDALGNSQNAHGH
jgi:peroxiredoxin Q/BCP